VRTVGRTTRNWQDSELSTCLVCQALQ